jgi:hypothetical protein
LALAKLQTNANDERAFFGREKKVLKMALMMN